MTGTVDGREPCPVRDRVPLDTARTSGRCRSTVDQTTTERAGVPMLPVVSGSSMRPRKVQILALCGRVGRGHDGLPVFLPIIGMATASLRRHRGRARSGCSCGSAMASLRITACRTDDRRHAAGAPAVPRSPFCIFSLVFAAHARSRSSVGSVGGSAVHPKAQVPRAIPER